MQARYRTSERAGVVGPRGEGRGRHGNKAPFLEPFDDGVRRNFDLGHDARRRDRAVGGA